MLMLVQLCIRNGKQQTLVCAFHTFVLVCECGRGGTVTRNNFQKLRHFLSSGPQNAFVV